MVTENEYLVVNDYLTDGGDLVVVVDDATYADLVVGDVRNDADYGLAATVLGARSGALLDRKVGAEQYAEGMLAAREGLYRDTQVGVHEAYDARSLVDALGKDGKAYREIAPELSAVFYEQKSALERML